MRLFRLTITTKLLLVTALAFIFVLIQYEDVVNTWKAGTSPPSISASPSAVSIECRDRVDVPTRTSGPISIECNPTRGAAAGTCNFPPINVTFAVTDEMARKVALRMGSLSLSLRKGAPDPDESGFLRDLTKEMGRELAVAATASAVCPFAIGGNVGNIGEKYDGRGLFHDNVADGDKDADTGTTSPPPRTRDAVIYVITPTYERAEQVADLTRLSHTLMHVRDIVWIVVEDSRTKSPRIAQLLRKTKMKCVHLVAEPIRWTRRGPKPKGVSNRNKGLEWVRQNAKAGVLYFADDDNTYDLELFEEMRNTKKVSMWPVGLVTQTGVSTPVVKDGKFNGFYDGWLAGRKFPVDMAGFAVSIAFLKERPRAKMAFKLGYEEDLFLQSLRPFHTSEIELKADNCTKILVWHTQTKKNGKAAPVDAVKFKNTNILKLKELIY